ncbi:MAG: hypothetical protein H7287_08875 [Thermoleophilia bacterium]|nr:hypothetical protein [Thermoleophilia bacterium]
MAFWRLVAPVAREHRRLAASGELGERLAAARFDRSARAVARERRRPAIRAPARALPAEPRAVRRAPVDAPLRPAMVRPATVLVTKIVAVEVPDAAPPSEFAWLESGFRDRTRTGAGVLGPGLMGVGLIGSFVPLVRPLGDASPWIALGSAVLVALGWWRARS